MRLARLQMSHRASGSLTSFVSAAAASLVKVERFGRSAGDVLDLVHTRFSRQDTPGPDSSHAVHRAMLRNTIELGAPVGSTSSF